MWVESSIIGICTKRNQVKILCNNIFSSISTISGSPHPPLSPVIQEIPFWRRYKKICSLYLWCHPNPQPQPHSHRMVTHILIHIIPLISFDRYLCCSSSSSSFYVPWCGVVIAAYRTPLYTFIQITCNLFKGFAFEFVISLVFPFAINLNLFYSFRG